ncbi:MAG TPA: helix-turn-helix transcriptional regulator [Candidatus Limnocylindria bacterium]|nr:helix-turn-helix transcriptional regulator [Candidatus Limnocylindria bacterium]
MTLPTPTRADAKIAAPPRAEVTTEADFLVFLGTRVRELRNRRGMTRKMVAREADVSERHLAQLEAGEGNVSIVLLRRIAEALNVSLSELFAAEVEEPLEKRVIHRFLDRLPTHRLEDVVSRLMREFGPEEKVRRSRIALIGVRGAGKSTLGLRLSAESKIPFIELDREIEKDTGIPLAEIFSLYGQSGYRAIERRTLERVIHENDRAILSVGGGVVSEKETYDYLLSNCCTVWIKAQAEEHMSRVIAQRDFRVMAGSDQAMEDLRRILKAREPLYRKADICLDTSGNSVDESFAKLKAALQANFE